jgi:chaperonin GroEL
LNSYKKAKSAAKDSVPWNTSLESKVLKTMKDISTMVGNTLGPGGRPILIERQEYGLPHIVSKDGVTVFRNMGFSDPIEHLIMEATRDVATRTVAEAGDGTTGSTVLAEAIIRYTFAYCKKNPKVSPQKIVRRLERAFREDIEPKITEWAVKCNENMLRSVAKLSANGDGELADAVMKAFELSGDEGNISIVEQSGPSEYKVQGLKGFPIGVGYEDSCGRYYPMFLNDKGNNRTFLEKPVFILYFGAITEMQSLMHILGEIQMAWAKPQEQGLDKPYNHNVVIVATGFSETVLANLGTIFTEKGNINVFPLLAPRSPMQTGELDFLWDLNAVTGATVYDPITNPLQNAQLTELGYNIDSIEINRYNTVITGIADEGLVIARSEEIKMAIPGAVGKLDASILMERAAKLVGGVAKIYVIGASNGELREKRDRVEDAVCAVRGAKKKGCLPGGGWALLKLVQHFERKAEETLVIQEVLIPSLKEPVYRILENCGLNLDEANGVISKVMEHICENNNTVYDAWEGDYVDAFERGILDSTPAVLEALRSSLSIASLMGTIGGIVAFKRDDELERSEAMDVSHFNKSFTPGEQE